MFTASACSHTQSYLIGNGSQHAEYCIYCLHSDERQDKTSEYFTKLLNGSPYEKRMRRL